MKTYIPIALLCASLVTVSAAAGGREAQALADRISRAWISFARTGNPNHDGLPQWPAFTRTNGYTMIFGNRCEVKENFDGKLLSLLRPGYKY